MVLPIDDTNEHEAQRKQGCEALLQDIIEEVKTCRTATGEALVELCESLEGRANGARWLP